MEAFFIYLLKSSGVILLFLACYKFFLSRETFHASNRYFLFSGLVLAIVLPLISYTKTVWVEISSLDVPLSESIVPQVTNEVVPQIELSSILFAVYIIGTLCGMIHLFLQLFSLRKIFKNSRIVQEGKFKVLESNKPLQPFSFFNHIIYHPERHSEEDIKTILAHEKIHSRQHHSVDILVMHLFLIFQWCNPFIYLYKFYLKENLEFIADANTISTAIRKEKYQYLLVKNSLGEKHFTFVNPFFNSSARLTIKVRKLLFGKSYGQVKKRIVMLNKKKSKKINSIKYGLVLPLLIGFILLFNVETIAEIRTVSPSIISTEQDAQLNDPKVYSITKETLDLGIEALKMKIKKENGELSIENLKRNSEGQIIAISVSLKVSEVGQVTKKFKGKNGIEPIFFGQNDRGGHSFMRNEKDIAKLKNATKRIPPKIDFDKADVYSIHKKTSDKEIKQIKAAIEKKGRTFSYSNKRNSKGEIIDLELEIRIKTGGSGHFKSEPSFERCYFGFFKDNGVFIADDEKSFNQLKERNAKVSKRLGNNLKEIKNDKFNEVVYDKEKSGDFPHLTTFNYRPRGALIGYETPLKSVFEAAGQEKIKNDKFNEVTYDKEKTGDFPHGIGLNYTKDRSIDFPPTGFLNYKPYSADMLYYVNGVETPLRTISSISPENIESITVLKGKQAVSIYAEKGENGVVNIMTKDALYPNINNLIVPDLTRVGSKEANDRIENKEKFLQDLDEPLIIVDGKEMSKKEYDKISQNDIESISVLKGKAAKKKYGKKGKNGVVEVKLKKKDVIVGGEAGSPLIIIDGRESSNEEMKNLDQDKIKSVSILKDERAIKKYGKKAKDGAVEIIMKKK